MFNKEFEVTKIVEMSKVYQASLKAKDALCFCSVKSHEANSC